MASSALPAWLSPAFSPFTQVSGYLNLLANTIDNFTHGLAVAASFLVSKKVRGGASRALASGGEDTNIYQYDQPPKESFCFLLLLTVSL